MGAPLQLAFAATKRTLFPEAVTVNCLVEADPTKGGSLALIARPGLEDFETVGTAPTRALWQKQGLFDNSALVIASSVAYTLSGSGVVGTLGGTAITGDGLLDIDGGLDADGDSVARVANGTALYIITGGAVAQEDFPTAGGPGASSVAYLGGYWLATEAGTDIVYVLVPAGTSWDPLEFATAEYAPDKIVAIRVFGELAALLGEATVEFWRLTGDSALPIAPAGGLKFDIGCRSRSAAVNCGGTLIFVDHNCSVRLTEGGEPRIISDNGLAEQIRRCDPMDLRASFFVKDQHPCYVLTLGADATWIYDLSSKSWTRATSNALDYWRADLFCNVGDTVLARDALSNQIYRLDPDRRTDGDETFTLEFTAFLEVPEGSVGVANIELDCLTGDAPREGQGSDPLIGMQLSRDRGRTWGQIRYRGLGATGQYSKTPRWNGCGDARGPLGMMAKFFVSDPVGRRFSGVRANVA